VNDEYSQHYSEQSFWDKVKRCAKVIGRATLEKAFLLYYVGVDPNTPVWAKGVISAALGYLIFPLDAIPDLTPFVGYADDVGAIAAALAAVAMCISKGHQDKAREKVKEWFGEDGEGHSSNP
jgi:uncharacterized membrane protein YkvA (DUF1232 family)